MISDEEFLERIVAGLCDALMVEASVAWNEKIDGRQFDVVINAVDGPFKYLTLVEVKSSKNKIKVKELEAFITKAKDAKVNKISMFSANGFDGGCLRVAASHGVDLFLVEKGGKVPSIESIISRLKENGIYSRPNPSYIGDRKPYFRLLPDVKSHMIKSYDLVRDGVILQRLEGESTELFYIIHNSNIEVDGTAHFFRDFAEEVRLPEARVGEELQKTINLPKGSKFLSNDVLFASDVEIDSINVNYSGVLATSFESSIFVEPSMFIPDVTLYNVLTGQKSTKHFHELSLGFSEFEVGRFYFTPNPLSYFYCAEINGQDAKIYNLESFQRGRFLHGSFIQEIKYGKRYIILKDKYTIDRLKKRLEIEIAGGPFTRRLPRMRDTFPWGNG